MCGLVAGLLTGGSIGSFRNIRLRATVLLVAATAVQLGAGAIPSSVRWPVVLCCVSAAAVWAIINARATPALTVGLLLVAVGIVLNALVMSVNGGMPVDTDRAATVGLAGVDVRDGYLFKHVPVTSDTRLVVLADVIPVPVTPFRGMFSFGDVVMLVGIAVTVAQAARVRTVRCIPA